MSAARIAWQNAVTKRAQDMGVVLAAGVDSLTTPGDPLPMIHKELEVMVTGAGLTPLQAITAATRGAAHAIGVDDLRGTIAPGMIADLLLVDADPSADIRNTRRIRYRHQGRPHRRRSGEQRAMSGVTRREALRALAFGVVAAPAVLRGRYQLFAQSNAQYSARAVRLVESNVVVDLLNQFQFQDFADRPPKIDQWLTRPGTFTAADAARYQQSGITVFALGAGAGDYDNAMQFHAQWNGFLAGYSDWFTRIDDVSDFARAKAQKKVGVMLTFQDSTHFRSPDDVATFFGLGQRISQLTYNFNNRIGSGFLEERDGGLSVFGHVDHAADAGGRDGGRRLALRRPDDARRARCGEAAR